MKKFNNYIKESIIELRKVTWPSKKDTYRYSVLVIVISLLIAAFLGGLDYIFNFGLEALITR
jgi:preprotein translocase subunit SecE